MITETQCRSVEGMLSFVSLCLNGKKTWHFVEQAQSVLGCPRPPIGADDDCVNDDLVGISFKPFS